MTPSSRGRGDARHVVLPPFHLVFGQQHQFIGRERWKGIVRVGGGGGGRNHLGISWAERSEGPGPTDAEEGRPRAGYGAKKHGSGWTRRPLHRLPDAGASAQTTPTTRVPTGHGWNRGINHEAGGSASAEIMRKRGLRSILRMDRAPDARARAAEPPPPAPCRNDPEPAQAAAWRR